MDLVFISIKKIIFKLDFFFFNWLGNSIESPICNLIWVLDNNDHNNIAPVIKGAHWFLPVTYHHQHFKEIFFK